MEKHYDAIIRAPFGAIGIVTQDDFLIELDLLTTKVQEKNAKQPFAQSVINQLRQYFSRPEIPFDIPYAVKGTHFQKRVWQAIKDIPSGQVLTYSQLAELVGSGPRAVANVCGANQVPLVIPCHRVVAKNGLGGFMQGIDGGLAIKQWLLTHETNG